MIRGELKNLEAYVVETNLAAGTVTLANFRRAVPGMPDRVRLHDMPIGCARAGVCFTRS